MGSLDSHAERITGERFQNAVLFDALHGEAANTEGNIVAGETMVHEFLIDSLAPLDSDGIAVDCLDVRIEHFITFGVDGATELVP